MTYAAKIRANPGYLQTVKDEFYNTHPKPLTPEEARIVAPFVLPTY
jgi:hypothetical protein